MIQSEQHQRVLEYVLGVIKDSFVFPYVSSVYLYDTFANQNKTENSDINLFMELVPSEYLMKNLMMDVCLLKAEVLPSDWREPYVDLKIVFGEKWRYSPALIHQTVRNNGVLLYSKED